LISRARRHPNTQLGEKLESFLILLKFVARSNNPGRLSAPELLQRSNEPYFFAPSLDMLSFDALSFAAVSLRAFFFALLVFFDFVLSAFMLVLASVLAGALAAGAAGVAAGAGAGVCATAVSDTAKALASNADINLLIFLSSFLVK
jgi:hypothetical protein